MGKRDKGLHFVGINDYIKLNGETEFITVENGISGNIVFGKADTAKEIQDRYNKRCPE